MGSKKLEALLMAADLGSFAKAAVVSMVEHGLGISMMTELTLKGRAGRVLTLPVEPAASRELGIAVRSLADAPEILRRFIACTQRIVRELSE